MTRDDSASQADAIRAQEQDAMARDFMRAVQVSHRYRHGPSRQRVPWLALGAFVFSLLALIATIVESCQ